jgi:hypothetical protein
MGTSNVKHQNSKINLITPEFSPPDPHQGGGGLNLGLYDSSFSFRGYKIKKEEAVNRKP